MSRQLSAPNLAEVALQHLQPVLLVRIDFTTPVYAHSGIGTITFDGNDYLGVGDFGGVGEIREAETLGPNPIRLELTGLNSSYVAEALSSGNYGDMLFIYMGYRNDAGALVADPWPVASGKYEYASVVTGATTTISITAQHSLSVLDGIDGAKFTDEDQRTRYVADRGFQFVSDSANVVLYWGQQNPNAGNSTRGQHSNHSGP